MSKSSQRKRMSKNKRSDHRAKYRGISKESKLRDECLNMEAERSLTESKDNL